MASLARSVTALLARIVCYPVSPSVLHMALPHSAMISAMIDARYGIAQPPPAVRKLASRVSAVSILTTQDLLRLFRFQHGRSTSSDASVTLQVVPFLPMQICGQRMQVLPTRVQFEHWQEGRKLQLACGVGPT